MPSTAVDNRFAAAKKVSKIFQTYGSNIETIFFLSHIVHRHIRLRNQFLFVQAVHMAGKRFSLSKYLVILLISIM